MAVGLNRVEALLEGLDRDIDLASTTLTNPIITTNAACTFTGAVTNLTQYVKSAATTWIGTGAVDVEYQLTQPAGTMLIDCGIALSTATVGTGNTVVRVGTGDDGEQLCADANMISAGVGAIGTAITVSGESKSEGAAALAFATSAVVYSGAARTVYIMAQNSATLTAGEGVAFIRFMKLV